MKDFDPSLYLVTDRCLAGNRSLAWIVDQAIQGGVTMVQLREKETTTRNFLAQAQALIGLLRPQGIPLIINDRVDIALAVDADGVHVGQTDMPWRALRKLLGPEKIIGLSIENEEQAREANQMEIDYIGLSPIFSTSTKTDTAPPLGLVGIQKIRAISRHPIVAIGGISLNNASAVIEAGADGIAVVSAIIAAEEPRFAAVALQMKIREATSGNEA